MNNLLFFGTIISFALGILLATFFPAGVYLGVFLSFIGVAFFSYTFFFLSGETQALVLGAIFLFAFGIGVARFSFSDMPPITLLEVAVPEKVEMTGVIVTPPEQGTENTELRVSVTSIRFPDKAEAQRRTISRDMLRSHPFKVLVFASAYQTFEYGEKISVRGILHRPENFQTKGGREFDYIHYLGKDDVRYLLYYPHIERISSGGGFWLKGKLFDLKHALLDNLIRLIPQPEAGLAGGILVGAKQTLTDEWLRKFRETGVIHIVVLSGYNITLVSYFIMAFFTRLRFSPKLVAIFAGAGILLFMIMVGAGATVVRASLMGLLVLIARTMGQTSNMLRFLFLVGAGMVFWNPEILVYSASFQLSFLATFGLLMFGGFLYDKLTWVPERFLIREILSATLSTQIFVLPMILYIAGQWSVVAVPVNILVLVMVPFAMLFSFFAGMLGFLSVLLALPVAYIAYLMLAYIFFVVDLFSGLPFAAFTVPAFSFWVVVVIYFLYALVFLALKYKALVEMWFFQGVFVFERAFAGDTIS